MMFQDSFKSGNFYWFIGQVEDRKDPLMMNRVRVRCFGYHEADESILRPDDLPWALVMQTTDSSGTSGIGSTPHGLVEGSMVIGFFLDGNIAQQPMVIGSLGSMNTFGSTGGGYSAPNGAYPRTEHIRQTDVAYNATGQDIVRSINAEEIKIANSDLLIRDIDDVPGPDVDENPPPRTSGEKEPPIATGEYKT